jgi:hypothetical protein
MLKTREVLDAYFLETRCMLLEIGATLDRLDRAAEANSDSTITADGRLERIHQSLALLAQRETTPDRAERLLNLFSDPA